MKRWGGRQAQRLTAAVLARDGHRCCWCGGPATTADHLTPRYRGGTDELANLAAACMPCNRDKGTDARPRRRITVPPSRPW